MIRSAPIATHPHLQPFRSSTRRTNIAIVTGKLSGTITSKAAYSPGDDGTITYRVLHSIEEFQACVELQRATWGEDGETVPASLMRAAVHIGGLAIGAFEPDGTLVGFVFSLAGQEDGARVHWSHMLAVRESARGAGIGRTLKELQRDELAARGVQRIYWTFDPLQAKNAYLNLNRLGARVLEFEENMYGVTRSPLHLGMDTDRFIVAWDTNPRAAAPEPTARDHLPIYTPELQPNDVAAGGAPAAALIEIPWDINRVIAESRDVAARWREATRAYFRFALDNGYRVTGIVRDVAAQRAFYRIARGHALRSKR